jgi:GNAT superfamily N-acetyltransferase
MSSKPENSEKSAVRNGLEVRSLAAGDLEAIVAIDRATVGRSRRGFYEKRLGHLERDPRAFVALGAELDGTLVGFAFARLYEGEFGGMAPEASLDAIGVDAKVRHHGVGRELVGALAAAMRLHGIKELSTQADWTDTDLMGFFARTKFALAPRIVLERSLAERIPS